MTHFAHLVLLYKNLDHLVFFMSVLMVNMFLTVYCIHGLMPDSSKILLLSISLNGKSDISHDVLSKDIVGCFMKSTTRSNIDLEIIL